MHKMKKIFVQIFAGLFLLVMLLSVGNSATNNFCCEKTNDGDWCINAPESKCDSEYKSIPSSCEATGYCKLGCCYDSQEGTCTKNTPEKVCDDSGGVWEDSSDCDIGQCQLGCCLLGDQAAFVTQTRCKRLASVYGLETNYRTDIKNEIQCIASASSDARGACVFEKDYERTCRMTTQEECQDLEASESSNEENSVKFHEGYLCSAEELGTNCGPTEKTKCVEGKDQVYFVDSCGNIANIYDADKINDKTYWKYIAETTNEINLCGANSENGNADSSTCGNCDYYSGSTCKKYQRGEDRVKPLYGEYICRDLGCEYNGEEYEHGETWCADAPGIEENLAGSRHFRLVCYNGDISVEPCADYRQEVCIESEVNGFKTAGCIVNKWESCAAITEERDCKDSDIDCEWLENRLDNTTKCVPKNPGGSTFWGGDEGTGDSSAEDVCNVGNFECIVEYEKGLTDDEWKCVENCHCLDEQWRKDMELRCRLLGDCGTNKNYLGYQGDNAGYKNWIEEKN